MPRNMTNPEERFELARRVIPRLRLINPERRRDQYRSSAAPVGFDNVCAYDPGIFSKMSRRHLLSVFEFSAAVKNLDLYKRLEDRQGTYDIAHLRRDDISNPKYNQKHTQGYSVVSRESYIRAFVRYGFDPERVDGRPTTHRRQWHTDRALTPRGRWRYPTGSEVLPGIIFDWLEDFLQAVLRPHHFSREFVLQLVGGVAVAACACLQPSPGHPPHLRRRRHGGDLRRFRRGKPSPLDVQQ